MPTITKRSGSWQAKVRRRGHRPQTRTFHTKAAAERWARDIEHQIDDLRLHDLRHEATSRLFERGLTIAEVAAVTGHKTWSQLRRYTHPKAAVIAAKLGAKAAA